MSTCLISAAWLLENHRNPNVRIVDTRFVLGKPDAGRDAYAGGHIPGAVFADLERDLSAQPQPDRRGGRHPLPTIANLEESLSKMGISNGQHVVAYDDGGFYAAHFWWMLRYLGHDEVSVLNGGLPAWTGPLETAANHFSGNFQANPRSEMLVDAAYVRDREGSSALIDSRAPERFRGDVEPLDWKAGHIPGAINKDWSSSLEKGHFKPGEAQLERFKDVLDAAEVIVYCGSGVSAGANMLALELAGIQGAKFYAGSWSDWASDNARPIATGGYSTKVL